MKKIISTLSVVVFSLGAAFAQRHIDLGVTLLNPVENAVIAPFERVNIEIELSNEGVDTIFAGDTVWYNHSQIPLINQRWYILQANIPPNATANIVIDSFANSDQFTTTEVNFCVTLYSPDNVIGINGYTYIDTVSNNNSDCNKITLQPTSTSELELSIAQLKLYPNPAQDVVNIEGKLKFKGDINVVIFDITGKEIIQTTYNKLDENAVLNIPVDVHNIANGMYFIQLNAAGNKVAYKLIKQ